MRSISQMPGSLAIVKLDDRHYQLTDTSTPSIGLCLGVFPTHGAAKSFADKLVKIRALRPTAYLRRRTGARAEQDAALDAPSEHAPPNGIPEPHRLPEQGVPANSQRFIN